MRLERSRIIVFKLESFYTSLSYDSIHQQHMISFVEIADSLQYIFIGTDIEFEPFS